MRRNPWIPAIAFIAWFGLALQFYIMLDSTPGNGLSAWQAVARFFSFFTILSNLLVAVVLTTIAFAPRSAAGRLFQRPFYLAAVALYILVVGIVYNTLLRHLWQPEGWQFLADNLLHVIVPAAYVLWWLLLAPGEGLRWIDSFKWLWFPFLYLLYALLRGAAEGFYPYPFINVDELGYGKVLLNSALLMTGFIVLGMLLVLVAKRKAAGV